MATFEQIKAANAAIKPTDIGKGKEYAEVNQRIIAFRMLYPEGSIVTDLVSNVDGVCIFRAVAKTADGAILGTGTAYEKEGSTFINKTSYIENCETSAVGRCLAMCGIGIDVSIASKEEVENAKAQQASDKSAGKAEKPVNEAPAASDRVTEASLRAQVIGFVNRHQMDFNKVAAICARYRVTSLNEMTAADCRAYINFLSSKGVNINE